MRRTLATTAVSLLLASLGGCGGGDGDPPPTTTTVPPTTTTIEQGDAKGIACLTLATEALKLFNDYNQFEMRGIRPPDVEGYRARADVLRAEHARLECKGELLKGFP